MQLSTWFAIDWSSNWSCDCCPPILTPATNLNRFSNELLYSLDLWPNGVFNLQKPCSSLDKFNKSLMVKNWLIWINIISHPSDNNVISHPSDNQSPTRLKFILLHRGTSQGTSQGTIAFVRLDSPTGTTCPQMRNDLNKEMRNDMTKDCPIRCGTTWLKRCT